MAVKNTHDYEWPVVNSDLISAEEIKQDIDVVVWSVQLASIKRYFRQPFWQAETISSEKASLYETTFRLESVAEHSWHVADIILLLAPHFTYINASRCLELAILHDKLEIITGDLSPIDRSGTGKSTHAFNEHKQAAKSLNESEALEQYLKKLRPSAREFQRHTILEIIAGTTCEARFVKAVDKLQALVFVFLKKKGNFKDQHLSFTLRYAEKATFTFPPLEPYYQELRARIIQSVSEYRSISVPQVEALLKKHPTLPFG